MLHIPASGVELYYLSKRIINMNQTKLIQHLQGSAEGRIMETDGTVHYTSAALIAKGIKVCEACGYMQPLEVPNCKSCGEYIVVMAKEDVLKVPSPKKRSYRMKLKNEYIFKRGVLVTV